jgi:hypothetical protein
MSQIESVGPATEVTRWLWKDEDVPEAIRHVVSGQGEPMAVFAVDLL